MHESFAGARQKSSLHRARTGSLWLALLAAWSLGFAYTLQYGFGLRPCHLCMYERYGFMALFLCGLAGFLFDYGRTALIACLIVLVTVTALATYHAGIEIGWFELSSMCSGAGKANSVDELRAMLNDAGPSCDRPSWLIRDTISLAQATALWSFLLTALTVAFISGPAFRR